MVPKLVQRRTKTPTASDAAEGDLLHFGAAEGDLKPSTMDAEPSEAEPLSPSTLQDQSMDSKNSQV